MKKNLFALLYLSLCSSIVSASPIGNQENIIITENFNTDTSNNQEHFDNVSNYANDYLFNITSKWHSGEITQYINFLYKIDEFEFENLKENINYFTMYCNGNLTFSLEEFIGITSLLHTKTEEFDDLIAYYDQNGVPRSKESFLSLFYQKMNGKKTSDQPLLINNKTDNLIPNNEQNNAPKPKDNFSPLFYEKIDNEKPSDQLPITDHKKTNKKTFDNLHKKYILSKAKRIVEMTFKKYFYQYKKNKIYNLLSRFLTSQNFIDIDDFNLSNFRKYLRSTECPDHNNDDCDYYTCVKNAMKNTHKFFNQQQLPLSNYEYILKLFFKFQNYPNEIFAFLLNTHFEKNFGFNFNNAENQIKKLTTHEKLKNIESWEPIFRIINIYNLDPEIFNELFNLIYSNLTPSQNLIDYLEFIQNNNDTSKKITNNFLIKTIINCDENQLINARSQLKNIYNSINLDFDSLQLIAAYVLLAQHSFEIAQQLEEFLLNNPQQLTEAMKDTHISFQKNCAPFVCYENALKLLVKTEKPTDISLFLTCTDYNNASISFVDLENLIEKNINARDLKNIQSWKQVFQILDIYSLPEYLFNNFLDFASLYSEPPRPLVYYLELICSKTKNKITNISLVKTIMKFNKYGEASNRLEEILSFLNGIYQYRKLFESKYFDFLNKNLDEREMYNIQNMYKIKYNLSFSALQSIANTILLAQESPILQKKLNYAIEKLPYFSLMNENEVKINLRQHLNFVFQNKIPPSEKKIEFNLNKYLKSILKITEETFDLIVKNNKDFNDFI